MNMSVFDRISRMLAGLGLVTFDYFANASWEIAFLILGAWGVFTSAFGYCPFYRIFGWNTCPTAIPAE
ncbi:MAG: DUF2892 domain-containing protein [Euryarchaeota archaeon]|jgi:hypothetical protein|nr:DUF2892 domain-containing protein [Euryarchaeota archaeon]